MAKFRYSVFGRAMVNALRGGACKPHSRFVTALDLYTFIHAYMAKTIDRYNALAHAEHKPAAEGEAPVPPPVSVHQTPVLFVPHGPEGLAMARNPVCYKCDPPAAPEKPYVSEMCWFRCSLCLCAKYSLPLVV